MLKSFAFFAVMPLMLLSLAGCGKGGDDPAGNADGWSIAAGAYGNVAEGRDPGFLVRLPEGDQSKVGYISWCSHDVCVGELGVAARRGLNGLAFSFQKDGRTMDVTVTPASPTSVMLSGDWGEGLETVHLPKL